MIAAMEAFLPSIDETRPPRDAALLAGCRAGDRSAFEELYRVHGERMKSVAANLLGDRAEAEDAVQEAFVRIFRSSASFEGRSRFSTWIYRVVVNCCYDLLRRRRPTISLEEAPLESGEPLAGIAGSPDPALRRALDQGLATLPPRQRSAFVLFAVEGFSHREISEILDVSPGNSKTLVFEAKRRLARLLEPRLRSPRSA
ncbi:MAG TPA: RNA polymerase sigma factor [Thermoanaerobaculia bacterium]|nr:RNA polymerase sigma factor [Thermoanaerobaculia bacterium]